MDDNQFAILHQSETRGQILIDTDYDHDEDEYKMNIKFWNEAFNGYMTIGMGWTADRQDDFEASFEKCKSLEFVEEMIGNSVDALM